MTKPHGRTTLPGTKARKKRKPKLGTGKRFATLSKGLEKQGYSKEAAGAIAASAGRKAHGAKKMAAWSAKGKKRKRGKK